MQDLQQVLTSLIPCAQHAPLADVASLQKQEKIGADMSYDVLTAPRSLEGSWILYFRPMPSEREEHRSFCAAVPHMAGHMAPELAEAAAKKHMQQPWSCCYAKSRQSANQSPAGPPCAAIQVQPYWWRTCGAYRQEEENNALN